MVGAIDRLWTAITGYGKFMVYTGYVEKDPYVLLSIQVQKAVMEPEVRSNHSVRAQFMIALSDIIYDCTGL